MWEEGTTPKLGPLARWTLMEHIPDPHRRSLDEPFRVRFSRQYETRLDYWKRRILEPGGQASAKAPP